MTSQAIQIGRHNGPGNGRIPVEAHVGPAQIVHQDEEDVRFAKGQRQKDEGEMSHGRRWCPVGCEVGLVDLMGDTHELIRTISNYIVYDVYRGLETNTHGCFLK